ncbi:MAG: von Willebrand factor type A domain-containing protein [Acidobacteria bacterium]|nr:von Willebrand factor type A domain-containing protein [Acidobacteriota bacterium]
MNIDANDPKWTAYALGEITDEKERAEIEKVLAESPEIRRLVEEIRETAGMLKEELHAEPSISLTEVQRQQIEAKANAGRSWFGLRPAWVMATAAAAVLMISIVTIRQLRQVEQLPPNNQMASVAPKESVAARVRDFAIPPALESTAEPITAPQAELKGKAHAPAAVEPEKVAPVLPQPPIPEAKLEPAVSSRPTRTAAASVLQQSPLKAALMGTVKDVSGAVLPGVAIKMTDETTGLTAQTRTNATGQYSIPSLSPGPHTLTAEMAGFQTKIYKDLTLNSASTNKLNLSLDVASRQDAVMVSVATENLLLESASSTGKVLSQEKPTELPLVNSNVLDLMKVMGGITSADSPTYSAERDGLAGISAANVNLQRDGVTFNDVRWTTGPNTPVALNPELVSEFRLVLSPVDAEMARCRYNNGCNKKGNFNTEAYENISDNPFLDATQNPLSTFAIDVDTASYSNVRRFLDGGTLPPKDAIRIEELVNYFDYDYRGPRNDKPFAAHFELTEAPWKPEHKLLRIGLKGREIEPGKRPDSNLVFLLDVSGSMADENKLPLVKQAMTLLVDQLAESDRVAIVIYAGDTRVHLTSTSGDQKEKLRRAIERLHAGGSTAGASGIQLAYQTAKESFIKGGVNRVILATDGDFNVGITNRGDLTRLIDEKAKSGIFLSALGFGMGNYKDSTLELLADKGRGNYAYIDTFNEAKKVLVEQINSTLVTIAKDVKIQVEFNPQNVSSYRLIGYENRLMAKEDFNDDAKQGGSIGAGHAVTALYELVPVGAADSKPGVDPLKYQKPPQPSSNAHSDELLTVKIRSKEPEGDKSILTEFVVKDSKEKFSSASRDFKFAASVAAFGMVLRDSPHKGNADLERALEWAKAGKGEDRHGYRQEFIRLIHRAISISF